MKKLTLFSLTYKCRGHAKEYADNFIKYAALNDYDITLLHPNNEPLSSEIGPLDLYPSQRFGAYRRILRRFYIALKYTLFNIKDFRLPNSVYFLDYEYFSLLLSLLITKGDKYVLIHSASIDKSGFYRLYKKVFFFLIKIMNVKCYFVTGQSAKSQLLKLLPEARVEVVQFPSKLDLVPVPKLNAKEALFCRDKKVFSLIGMIRPDKNYEFAIKCFADSNASNNNDNVLYIAGSPSGVSEELLSEWLNKYKVENYKLDLCYLTEEDLNLAFSASDVLLVPYGDTGSSQSGPLSMCREYGLPAIVKGGSEIGDYVMANNVGICCFDESKFIDSINTMIDAVPGDIISSLAVAKKLYSWEAAIKKYLEVFNGK